MQILPSIICFDVLHLKNQIDILMQKDISAIHIDVMDGNFVSQITYGYDFVRQIKKNFPNLFLDIHLMVLSPYTKIEDFAKAGSDCISIHYEAIKNIKEINDIADKIKSYGVKNGIVIDANTNIEVLEDVYKTTFFEKILIMSVKAGFSGQSFIKSSFEKINKVNEMLIKKHIRNNVEVSVDGGVNIEIFRRLMQNNVDSIVVGSALHKTKLTEFDCCDVLNNNIDEFLKLTNSF